MKTLQQLAEEYTVLFQGNETVPEDDRLQCEYDLARDGSVVLSIWVLKDLIEIDLRDNFTDAELVVLLSEAVTAGLKTVEEPLTGDDLRFTQIEFSDLGVSDGWGGVLGYFLTDVISRMMAERNPSIIELAKKRSLATSA